MQVLYTADSSIKTQLINYRRKANNGKAIRSTVH